MQNTSKLIKEILTIGLFASILGITAQTILPNGIGLITETTLIGSDSTAVAIPTITINPRNGNEDAANILLPDAYTAFVNGSALFIDARSQDDYQKGHIKGAINIPAHAFMDSLQYLDNLNLNQILITYCDGADCNASIDLAADLKLMGFEQIYFFFGGWVEWQTAGYPTEAEH